MAQEQQRQDRRDDDPDDAPPPPPSGGGAAQASDTSVDDILDEIDEVLESNAEEFVKGFVQKGGQ